jgi:hypothetical protein
MMNSFTEHIGIGDDRILTVDGVSCAGLLDRFGSPVFVVSQSQIETNVRRFKSAIRAGYRNSEVLFSTKSNNNLAVRRAFTQAGAKRVQQFISTHRKNSNRYRALPAIWACGLVLACVRGCCCTPWMMCAAICH